MTGGDDMIRVLELRHGIEEGKRRYFDKKGIPVSGGEKSKTRQLKI